MCQSESYSDLSLWAGQAARRSRAEQSLPHLGHSEVTLALPLNVFRMAARAAPGVRVFFILTY